jgi:hypothetical protein
MMDIMRHINNYETSRNINDVAHAALALTSIIYGKNSYSIDNIHNYIPTMVNIIKEIVSKWHVFTPYLNGTIRFNTEYNNKEDKDLSTGNIEDILDKTRIDSQREACFAGHPDIVTDSCILEIKTTGSFLKIAKQSCLQVLAYYALMKPTVPTVQYIGFLLPMQRDLVIYNLGAWDSSKYLQLLSMEANNFVITKELYTRTSDITIVLCTDEGFDLNMLMSQFGKEDKILFTRNISDIPNNTGVVITNKIDQYGIPFNKYRIGTHISKGKNIAVTLRNFASKYPERQCQMFMGNPRTGKRDAKTVNQISDAAQVIQETNLRYFTHAAYVINLCSNQCDNGDYWQQRYINEDLALTNAIGGKGVVVHTGARKHLPVEEALLIMEYMVRTSLPYSTEECRLLLETPCTEVCGQIQDLGNFFFRFSVEEKKEIRCMY